MNTIRYTTNKICVKLTRYLMSCGKKKKSTIRFLCVFRGKCCTCILRDKENLAKLDSKSEEEIFLGYVSNVRAYQLFNYLINAFKWWSQ